MSRLAALVDLIDTQRVVRVAVDGPDAAGKTTMANDLADRLKARGRPVVRISADDFHYPAAVRARRGDLSAEGYLHDSFNFHALVDRVLRPLAPGGSGRYVRAVWDYRMDTAVTEPEQAAPNGCVLIVDGLFLLQEQLRPHWDLSILLLVSPQEVIRRAFERDLALFGSEDQVLQRYTSRYLPAQELYRADVNPVELADIVIDNDDPERPTVRNWRTPEAS